MTDRDWREVMRNCDRWLGTRRPQTAAELLHGAAESLPADAWPDAYGEGEVVEAFERRIDLSGDPEPLRERALELAETSRVWLFNRVQPTAVPGVGRVELNVGEAALAISPEEAADLFAALTAERP